MLEAPQLYTSPWWLDATCGADRWDAVIRYDRENHPEAALPFHLTILDLSIQPDASLPHQDSAFPVALRYSFIIPPDDKADNVRSGYSEGLRRNIRQAEKNYILKQSDDIKGFLSLCRQSKKKKKILGP